jgi:hypothetical protein
MRIVALLLAFVLCATPALAQDRNDPVGLIQSIYKTYQTDDPGLPHVYSRRLQALVDADEKNTPEGEVGRLDWDVFVDGNDWRISKLQVTLAAQSGDRAQVRASFDNHGKPRRIVFDLVRENGRWLIDDIRSMKDAAWSKPLWTMSKVLAGEPNAVTGEKK